MRNIDMSLQQLGQPQMNISQDQWPLCGRISNSSSYSNGKISTRCSTVVVTNNSLAHNVSLIATLPFYVSHESKCVQLSSSLGYQGFEQM